MPSRPRSHRGRVTPGRTKTQRLAHERLLSHMLEAEYEGLFPYLDLDKAVPEAWATLERDVDVDERRVKVTLLLDESVAKFFRAQGQGYQARINRVLATYAQMKIAEVNLAEARIAAERERLRAERKV